ncbi:anti-sigma regulatory factor [Streptomyces sp. Go-475]|uniref:anti-sigma regulatory factor n=1 Tax=Streptomyces sp. Go-475 TaxID=2072505 RepID=UPI000DF02317|nr:anti-sigma regulatory factor [Streptomyces sp. Go-475]AXE83526.1 Serine/threonine-protein kinase RsbT [Streptomyces sp. Go-475]
MPRVWDVPVRDATRVRDARVAAEGAAALAGLDERRTAAAALVATELATNLLKHAEGGQVLIDVVDPAEPVDGRTRARVVQIAAIDHGPGIPDVPAAVRDGFSTTRSLGAGLGTCLRLADDFALHSTPGRGTVAVARVGSTPRGGASSAASAGSSVTVWAAGLSRGPGPGTPGGSPRGTGAWPEGPGPSAGRAPWPGAPEGPGAGGASWPGGPDGPGRRRAVAGRARQPRPGAAARRGRAGRQPRPGAAARRGQAGPTAQAQVPAARRGRVSGRAAMCGRTRRWWPWRAAVWQGTRPGPVPPGTPACRSAGPPVAARRRTSRAARRRWTPRCRAQARPRASRTAIRQWTPRCRTQARPRASRTAIRHGIGRCPASAHRDVRTGPVRRPSPPRPSATCGPGA